MRRESKIPRVLGEYHLVRQVGRGGMGEVWLATKHGLEKPCVIKVLLPEFARTPEYRKRFLREAKILAGLGHGRIVSVLDYGEAEGYLYLVMEYIDGVNLRVFCRVLAANDERLPIEVAVYIIAEVLDALRHAHNRTWGGEARCVIHRDVTPSNVMISSEGEVSLTDFGIARYEQEFSAEMFGTLGYIAPEQARGSACPQSDIFGACGVLHFMLTGQAPRQAANHAELHAALDDPPPPTGREDVPEVIEFLRSTGLEPDLSKRIANAVDALALIEGWEGYVRANTMLAQFYLRHFGPPRSGMTGLLPLARESYEGLPMATVRVPPATGLGSITPPDEPVSDEESTVPFRPAEPRWHPWLDVKPEVPDEFRPKPHGPVEEDAPRILRRPRRSPSLEIHTAAPQIPPTERLPPLHDVEPPAESEHAEPRPEVREVDSSSTSIEPDEERPANDDTSPTGRSNPGQNISGIGLVIVLGMLGVAGALLATAGAEPGPVAFGRPEASEVQDSHRVERLP